MSDKKPIIIRAKGTEGPYGKRYHISVKQETYERLVNQLYVRETMDQLLNRIIDGYVEKSA